MTRRKDRPRLLPPGEKVWRFRRCSACADCEHNLRKGCRARFEEGVIVPYDMEYASMRGAPVFPVLWNFGPTTLESVNSVAAGPLPVVPYPRRAHVDQATIMANPVPDSYVTEVDLDQSPAVPATVPA